MATLTLWTLPLNPPNPYPLYLQFLTPERRGKLYYTKYILDIIGELDVTSNVNNVREWVIPPSLYVGASGGTAGITYDPRERSQQAVWFAMQLAHSLVAFNPSVGLFTAYRGVEFPIRYPRHLMFDSNGHVWYTGAGTNGALIGRLDRTRRFAVAWDLPIELLTPEGLWVEPEGANVWFTPINPNIYMTGAFLARLESATNQVTYWSYPPPGRRPVNAGVVGELPRRPSRQARPTNIWFTYGLWGSSSRVFRLHLPSGTFFQYPPKFAAPRRVVLDDKGNAWISDWSGKISTIERNADCGTVRLVQTTVTVPPVRMKVKSKEQVAKPVTHSVTPTKQPLTPVKVDCYMNYPLPYPLASHGIELNVHQPGHPIIYFSQGSGIVIGQLIP